MADIAGQLTALLTKGVDLGLHRGAQVLVTRGQEVVLEANVGATDSGCVVSSATQFPWTCGSKVLGALAVARLVSDDLLTYETPLGEILSETKASSLGGCTVGDVLVHRTGIAGDPGDDVSLRGRDAVLGDVVAQAPSGDAGAVEASYRVWCHWFLVGEVVQRVAGVAFEDFVAKEILGPLGAHRTVSCPAGLDGMDSVRYELGRGPKAVGVKYDSAPYSTTCLPGYSFHGPARDMARVLSVLCDEEAGSAVGVRPETVARMTGAERTGELDTALGWDPDWGLGLMTDPRGWTGYPTSAAAGHLGIGGSFLACADLQRGIVVVAAFGRSPSSLAATARSHGVLHLVGSSVPTPTLW